MSDERIDESRWQSFVSNVFDFVDLPEVIPQELEVGMLSNVQIADRLRGKPLDLLRLLQDTRNLQDARDLSSYGFRRKVISMALDLLDSNNT